jgi:branched-chain amino acid aminotransferase
MNSVCVNGKMIPADRPVLMANNQGYRYGDGLFETMKMIHGKIPLEKLHFKRLLAGLALMKYRMPPGFDLKKISSEISRLCKKNNCDELARIRLSVFRGNGGLHDDNGPLQYLIEATPTDESVNKLNKPGYVIDIFAGLQKVCDAFSNLKSANFLPYVMAAQQAREKKLDDCLVTNTRGQLADATIANVFLLKNNLVITPALTEACVDGVMRRFLIEKMRQLNMDVREGVVTKNDLDSFDEVFLTNAIYGIRWVKQFRKKKYGNSQTKKIYEQLVAPMFAGS